MNTADDIVMSSSIKEGSATSFPAGTRMMRGGDTTADALDTDLNATEYPDMAEDFRQQLQVRKPTRGENRAWLDDYASKNGALPEGEPINSRGNQNIPVSIEAGTKTTRAVRTYLEALSTPDDVAGELERQIINGEFMYMPSTNASANQYAERTIENGLREAQAEWDAVVRGYKSPSKNKIALGERLIIEAINRKDVKEATKIIAEVAAMATRAGQIVQAISMVKRLSPTGQIMSINRQVTALNEELSERGKPPIKVSEDVMRRLVENASILEKLQSEINRLKELIDVQKVEYNAAGYIEDQLIDAETEVDRAQKNFNAAKNDALQDIANQSPSTWTDKLNAWRYLAMLGNPRTHIRNIMGNLVFIPALRIKQSLAGTMELILPKGERTQSAKIASKSIRDFAKKDAEEMLEWLKSGGKYIEKQGAEKQNIFNEKLWGGRMLNRISNFNSDMLDAEDGIFLAHHYSKALAGYAVANGYSAFELQNDSEMLNAARQIAAREALQATYRDANAFSDFMTEASRNLKAKSSPAGKLFYAAFEGIVPFKKTPANIIKRAVEYSPLGIISALWNGCQKIVNTKGNVSNSYSASDFINEIAAGMTGTMIVGLGAFLSSIGMLHGRNKDDEDYFEKLQGVQEYSLIIPGKGSYTIDWMAPSALPLFVGAELYELVSDTNAEIGLSTLLTSIASLAEPIFNLSMLDGVQSVLQSYSAEGAIMDAAYSSLQSFAGQLMPTIGGQLARTIDNKSRNAYYNDKTSEVPNIIAQVGRSALSKIPGLEQQLPERIDAWGRNAGEGQSVYERAIENFVSPGYWAPVNTTDVDKIIKELYDETGDESIFPSTANKSFSFKGETYYLSADEYVAFSKTRGQTAYELIDEMQKSSLWKNLSPDEKIACINDAYSFATAAAKMRDKLWLYMGILSEVDVRGK